MKEITIKDIAKMCGVGVSTVSRAINNHSDISEKTKNKIMKVVKESNFTPNKSARNLKLVDTKTIAVFIKGIENPFFQKMIKVFEEEIQRKKYSFILYRVDSNQNEVEVAIELIKEKKLSGIVFLGGSFYHQQEQLQKITVPFILSTIGISKYVNKELYSSVSVDDIYESEKLVDFLIDKNHTKIAVLAGTISDMSISQLRIQGYKNVLNRNNISINENLIRHTNEEINPYSMENGYKLMKELLDSKEEFTSVYAISDSMAIGASKAILESGKKIPNDYSIVGFDGLDITYYYNPSITTIRQPVEQMATETIDILFDLINGNQMNQHRIFEAELIERESVCVLNK